MNRLRRIPRLGRLSRGAITIVAGTGAAQLIVIASSPILTRLYTPSDFGVFAIASSTLAILITVTCLTYDYAIPLPESDDAAANVLALCLVLTLLLSSATAVVLWFAGPALFALAGAAVLSPYAMLLVLGQLGGGFVIAFTGWAVRTRSYSEIAANRLTQSVTLVAGQLGTGALGAGAPGLLIGSVAGSIAGSSRLGRAAWRSHAQSFRRVSRMGMVTAAGRYRRFAILSAPSAFLNTLGLQAPLLLVIFLYGTNVGGEFTLAQRVIALPATLVAGAIGQVFFAEAAALAREPTAELSALFWRTTRLLAVMAIGPCVLAAIVSPLLFPILFGQNWLEAGAYVAILAPMYYLQFVTSPTGGTLDVLERQDLHLIREVFRLCVLGGSVVLAASLHLPSIGAVGAVSIAGCLTYSLYGVLSWRAIVGHDASGTFSPMTDRDNVEDLRDWPGP